jgi:hypothetical protein
MACSTPPDKDDLLAFVYSRLYADDDDRLEKWLATAPPKDVVAWQAKHAYSFAKQQARKGDLEPLRKILVDLTGDSSLAEFIARPARPSWPKHVRKDYAGARPFKDFAREIQGDTVRRIRELVPEKTGGHRNSGLVIEIAAKVLKCPEEEIREIIKRGY